jgi:ABC-type Zn2+ transport system substrate-binding protein/surface adhesin
VWPTSGNGFVLLVPRQGHTTRA